MSFSFADHLDKCRICFDNPIDHVLGRISNIECNTFYNITDIELTKEPGSALYICKTCHTTFESVADTVQNVRRLQDDYYIKKDAGTYDESIDDGKKCRCCFKELTENHVEISQLHREQYYNFVGIELTDELGFAKNLCEACADWITGSAMLRQVLIARQTAYYEFLKVPKVGSASGPSLAVSCSCVSEFFRVSLITLYNFRREPPEECRKGTSKFNRKSTNIDAAIQDAPSFIFLNIKQRFISVRIIR